MEIRQIECFVQTADVGSTSRAAEILHTSQSSVSKHISALEEELKVTLFVRNNRGVRLTPEGRDVYEHARSLLQTAKLMHGMHGKSPVSQLRIACYASAMISRHFCDYFMTLPRGKYKGVFLEGTVEDIIEYVHKEIAEIGIIFIPAEKTKYLNRIIGEKNIVFTEISRHDLCVYAGEKSSVYNQDSIDFSSISDLRLIQHVDGYFSIENNLECFAQGMVEDITINKVITSNSDNQIIETILNTDLCNLGIRLINHKFRKYPITDIPITGCQSCLSLGYLARRQSNVSPVITAFLNGITSELCLAQK